MGMLSLLLILFKGYEGKTIVQEPNPLVPAETENDSPFISINTGKLKKKGRDIKRGFKNVGDNIKNSTRNAITRTGEGLKNAKNAIKEGGERFGKSVQTAPARIHRSLSDTARQHREAISNARRAYSGSFKRRGSGSEEKKENEE